MCTMFVSALQCSLLFTSTAHEALSNLTHTKGILKVFILCPKIPKRRSIIFEHWENIAVFFHSLQIRLQSISEVKINIHFWCVPAKAV